MTIDEPFYIPRMIKDLINISPPSIHYVCVVLVPVKPKRISYWQFFYNQIQVFGLAPIMKVGGLYITTKLLNTLSYRKQYSVTSLIKSKGIDLVRTDSLKSDSFLNQIKGLSLDIILSIASSRIFGCHILSIPKLGCLNVHAGKLPKYRGINPSFWSLLYREKQSAVTVHYMNEEIDDGEIIQQDTFDIEHLKSLHAVYMKVAEIAPKTVVKSLICIQKGHIHTIKNERSKSSYFSFPTKDDGKRFRALGLSYM